MRLDPSSLPFDGVDLDPDHGVPWNDSAQYPRHVRIQKNVLRQSTNAADHFHSLRFAPFPA